MSQIHAVGNQEILKHRKQTWEERQTWDANSLNPAREALRKKAIEQNKRLVVIFASQGVLEAIAMIIGADLSGKVEVGRNWDGMLLKTGCLSKMGSVRRTS